MPTTTNYALPYPALTDAPNGPSQIQALAAAADLLGAARSTWVPVWTQIGGATLVVGDGTVLARAKKNGRDARASMMMTRGSTTNVGSAAYVWSLPYPAANWQLVSGSGLVRQGALELACTAVMITSTALVLVAASARIGSAYPGGWAVGDTIQWAIADYETT